MQDTGVHSGTDSTQETCPRSYKIILRSMTIWVPPGKLELDHSKSGIADRSALNNLDN